MGYGYQISANKVGRHQSVWGLRGYGLIGSWVKRSSTVYFKKKVGVKKKTWFQKKVGKIGKKKNIMFIKKKLGWKKKSWGEKKTLWSKKVGQN